MKQAEKDQRGTKKKNIQEGLQGNMLPKPTNQKTKNLPTTQLHRERLGKTTKNKQHQKELLKPTGRNTKKKGILSRRQTMKRRAKTLLETPNQPTSIEKWSLS
jgi:hypothetical protein